MLLLWTRMVEKTTKNPKKHVVINWEYPFKIKCKITTSLPKQVKHNILFSYMYFKLVCCCREVGFCRHSWMSELNQCPLLVSTVSSVHTTTYTAQKFTQVSITDPTQPKIRNSICRASCLLNLSHLS